MADPLLRTAVAETLSLAAAACARSSIVRANDAEAAAQTRVLVAETRISFDSGDAARGALKDAVSRYAAALRADGAPPERAVRMVKEAFHGCRRQGTSDDELVARRALADEAVRWCIDAYFAG